jgi:hypothetical protein
MSDFEDIQRLVTVYAHLLDDQRYDEWVRLFHRDGEISWAGSTFRGYDEIIKAVSAIQPAIPGKHLVGVPVVNFIDAATAYAWTDMITFLHNESGAIYVSGMCRYHDVIRKYDGKWLFSNRFINIAGFELSADAPPYPSE